MAGVNKVILVGNVGGDPEVRSLPSGSKVVNLSLATSETYTDRSGQRQTQTEWHRIELWDSLANIAEQYVRKGDSLYIEGKIRNEKWTDQNGTERSGVKIRCLSLQLLGPRSNNSGSNREDGGENDSLSKAENNTKTSTSQPSSYSPSSDDDLPF